MVSTLKTNSLCMNCLRPSNASHSIIVVSARNHTTLSYMWRTRKNLQTLFSLIPIPSSLSTPLLSQSLLMQQQECLLILNMSYLGHCSWQFPCGISSSPWLCLFCLFCLRVFNAGSLSPTIKPNCLDIWCCWFIKWLSLTVNCQLHNITCTVVRQKVWYRCYCCSTCNLQSSTSSNSVQHAWNHLSDIPLADPDFERPGQTDILLGVDIFVDPPSSPVKTIAHGAAEAAWATPLFLELCVCACVHVCMKNAHTLFCS